MELASSFSTFQAWPWNNNHEHEVTISIITTTTISNLSKYRASDIVEALGKLLGTKLKDVMGSEDLISKAFDLHSPQKIAKVVNKLNEKIKVTSKS